MTLRPHEHIPSAQTPHKARLSDAQDALLATQCAGSIGHYTFPAGTILFNRGEARHCAYLIDKGTVTIEGPAENTTGPDQTLCTLGEGEIFGEMALIDSEPRTARAVTVTPCEIFVIPREALHERMHGLDPILSLLMSLLIQRYRFSRLHLPESIRQDQAAEQFLHRVGRFDNLPESILQLRDWETQRESARRELALEQELRGGLERREFVPVLQPILSLPDRRLAGFEALIRWQHPDKGLVMPNDFIPAAERTGIIQLLDRMMLEKACEELPALLADHPDIFISVNMSGVNFGATDITNSVAAILAHHNIPPANIKLEITESALIAEPERAETILATLRGMGLGIALDDFGTGYSSLGYLHRFAIDTLKIDRSFVMALRDGPRSIALVRAIIALARNFDIKVVAEGIETEEDVKILNDLGCDYGQGYLFSKPLTLKDAHDYAKK